VISYRAFGKRYGRVAAVEELTLAVGRGEVVALLGPNGSGKTTVLKAAAGLLRPTSGEVLVGAPPRPPGDPEGRRSLVYLPQKVAFPESLTGREVLEFYRHLRGSVAARSDEVLRFAALNGAGGRAVGTYSGGMVQRLGLAVAMLPEAPVALLDEPTAALDPDGLCAFYGWIERGRGEGRTVFFSSHQLGDVERLADRFAVLVGGRLAAVFSQRELAARLADRGALRLRLGRCGRDLLARVRTVAPGARCEREELVVPAPAAARPAVLAAVEAAGGEVLALTTEEGRLDGLYRELVGGGV
jgi:Cu-processing system ATP-binding protein